MTKCFYVSFIIIPLLFGLSLMIFSLTTEYWTRLDFTKIKHTRELNKEARPSGLKVKKVKIGVAKYTSLFGECDEFKLLDIWVPAVDYELELLYNITQAEIMRQTVSPAITPPPDQFSSAVTSPADDDDVGIVDEKSSRLQQVPPARNRRQVVYGDHVDCISVDKCNQLNKIVNGSCFCCNDRCCLLKTKMCDGVSNCRDRSDETDHCPMRRLYFASNYTDNKHNCVRHQYNLWEFAKGVFDRNIMGNKVNTSQYCLVELMKQSNQSVKVFTYRVLTIVSMLACIKFTLLCLITLIFVSCCHDLPSLSYSSSGAATKKRKNSLDDDSNGFHCGVAGDHEFDQYSLSASGSGAHPHRSCCCKCNCLLCPFVFFSIFGFFAALTALASLAFYLLSMYHFKFNYLIYDPIYMPEYVTKAYQYNPWLFDLYSLDFSFYSLLVSCLFYSIALISAISISCRIQMSPAWRRRYTDSYEVLEMHDMIGNSSSAAATRKPITGKNTYKKLSQSADGKSSSVVGGTSEEKEKKKSSKKKSSPPTEMAKAVPESDEISLYDEAQTLTSPKTRVENSYE